MLRTYGSPIAKLKRKLFWEPRVQRMPVLIIF